MGCRDVCFFFFQAEDGIRDAQESRGLGDVYKRQVYNTANIIAQSGNVENGKAVFQKTCSTCHQVHNLSLIHI